MFAIYIVEPGMVFVTNPIQKVESRTYLPLILRIKGIVVGKSVNVGLRDIISSRLRSTDEEVSKLLAGKIVPCVEAEGTILICPVNTIGFRCLQPTDVRAKFKGVMAKTPGQRIQVLVCV